MDIKYCAVFICKNNCELTKIETIADMTWETAFIGRKIIPEKYNELFDQNGYSYENEQYEFNGITATIIPTVDDNRCITEIECYKAQDFSIGHGKADSDEREFNKKDISHFSKVLDSVTIDPVKEEYERFVESFTKDELLPGGYIVANSSIQGITLVSPNGETVRLNKKKLMQALTISHTFIDVLYCADTLKEAPQCFDETDIPFYLAVFSKIDRKTYKNYEQLEASAEYRRLYRELEQGYGDLK